MIMRENDFHRMMVEHEKSLHKDTRKYEEEHKKFMKDKEYLKDVVEPREDLSEIDKLICDKVKENHLNGEISHDKMNEIISKINKEYENK